MKIFLTVLISSLACFVHAQKHGRGLLFDDKNYQITSLKADLSADKGIKLLERFSLKAFAPKPGNQIQLNTSVGWAVSYAARTIIEAQKKELNEVSDITKQAYSPVYVYHLSKDQDDTDCSSSIRLQDALKYLKNKGSPLIRDFFKFCPRSIPETVHKKAKIHAGIYYNRLFDIDAKKDEKISSIKKAILTGAPVVVGMHCPPSFEYADRFWQPREKFNQSFPGQALCVVGYDDQAFGGAFEVMNSWGADWANGGFTWIRYDDFAEFVRYGYEVFESPFRGGETNSLSSEITFRLIDGKQMTVSSPYGNGKYHMDEAYSKGTKFKIFVINRKPAFMYLIASDNTDSVSTVYPHRKWISPALPYDSTLLTLPTLQVTENTGRTILCFLYCTEEIDTEEIASKMNELIGSGSFEERLKQVVGEKLVDMTKVPMAKNDILFEAINISKPIVPITVEMRHSP